MKLSDKLPLLRQQHGLSQEDLAQRLNVARQTISKWETGQALPELPSLLALCDLYHLSLDRLVRDDDCAEPLVPVTQQEGLVPFLLRAKRATYAGHGAECDPSRPTSHDFRYAEADWLYLDSYLGSSHFLGEEAVWFNGHPLWSMNYAGRVLAEPFSGDFLKEALLRCNEAMPYRGPQLFSQGEWTYHCHADGDISWFAGHEEIYHLDHLVYECRFHGGKLR